MTCTMNTVGVNIEFSLENVSSVGVLGCGGDERRRTLRIHPLNVFVNERLDNVDLSICAKALVNVAVPLLGLIEY